MLLAGCFAPFRTGLHNYTRKATVLLISISLKYFYFVPELFWKSNFHLFTFLWASEHFSVDSASFWFSVKDKAVWVNDIIKQKGFFMLFGFFLCLWRQGTG